MMYKKRVFDDVCKNRGFDDVRSRFLSWVILFLGGMSSKTNKDAKDVKGDASPSNRDQVTRYLFVSLFPRFLCRLWPEPN